MATPTRISKIQSGNNLHSIVTTLYSLTLGASEKNNTQKYSRRNKTGWLVGYVPCHEAPRHVQKSPHKIWRSIRRKKKKGADYRHHVSTPAKQRRKQSRVKHLNDFSHAHTPTSPPHLPLLPPGKTDRTQQSLAWGEPSS